MPWMQEDEDRLIEIDNLIYEEKQKLEPDIGIIAELKGEKDSLIDYYKYPDAYDHPGWRVGE